MSARNGKRAARQPTLALLPALYVAPPPGQAELLGSALRALLRDNLEERLAERPKLSVDDELMSREQL